MRSGKVKNELGNKYGRLTVVGVGEKRDKSREQYWKCLCSCGNMVEVSGSRLRVGNTKSCGCLLRELLFSRRRIKLEGQRFGRLLVLRRSQNKNGKSRQSQWLCKCACGKEIVVLANALRSGHTKSCGCLKRELTSSRRRINLEGQRFGRLLVLKRGPHKKTKNKIYTQWFCRCDCGKEIVVPSSALSSGHTKSCGCLRHFSEEEKEFNRCFGSLCRTAKKRKISQELSKEQFQALSVQPCYYCGKPPSNVFTPKHRTGAFIHSGLDRVDNTIRAYTIDNVVPACKTCNIAKRTLTLNEFRELVIRIYNTLVTQARSPAFYATELGKIPDVKLPTKSWTCKLIARWEKDAKKRNKSWQLTDAQAAWLSKQSCFYCGKEPFQLYNKKHAYMGIDRVDNTKDYQVDNVVPCCKNCNLAKLDRTFDQVKDWVTAVYFHWVLPNTTATTTTTTTTTTTVTAADSQSPPKTVSESALSAS